MWHVDARLASTNDGRNYYLTSGVPSNAANGVTMAISNTYSGASVNAGYLSPLGSNYYDYNTLQLIRNSRYATYKEKTDLISSNLFKKGSTFSMSNVSGQFKNSGKLNTNTELGFTFKVNALDENRASITVTKL